MSEPLHMISMSIDLEKAMVLARKRRLPLHATDVGYLIHIATSEAFGNSAPSPFSLESQSGKHLAVLAYSSLSAERLQDQVLDRPTAVAQTGVFLNSLKSKRMPVEWRLDKNYAFRVRVCPVVRAAKDTAFYRKGSEVDAYLQRCCSINDPSVFVNREAVYSSWLNACFERLQGAELHSCAMTGFKRQKLVRRSHGMKRVPKLLERPDAVFEGRLKVKDSSLFTAMLSRGIGRHRAFGFGMLLLKP